MRVWGKISKKKNNFVNPFLFERVCATLRHFDTFRVISEKNLLLGVRFTPKHKKRAKIVQAKRVALKHFIFNYNSFFAPVTRFFFNVYRNFTSETIHIFLQQKKPFLESDISRALKFN